MLMLRRRLRSSRTQSMTVLRRCAIHESGDTGPEPNRPVSMVKMGRAVPTPGKMLSGLSHEMTDMLLPELPCTPPICMNSGGAPAGFTCSAQMWSSDRPVGLASNFPTLLAEASVALGVTGWQVKYDPQTCV